MVYHLFSDADDGNKEASTLYIAKPQEEEDKNKVGKENLLNARAGLFTTINMIMQICKLKHD